MSTQPARVFFDTLNDLGVETLFCNLGTDHAPLLEELARRQQAGEKTPRILLCPHENTAMHMAAGVAIATGRGQAVLVHVDAGTANASMGLHNLSRAHLPVLLMAGKAPFSSHGQLRGSRDSYVNFLQEPFDQASLVRSYVKWDYTLPHGAMMREALTRAHAMMHGDPPGPVYLSFARETLAEPVADSAIRSFAPARHAPAHAGGADPNDVDAIVDRLLAADRPLLLTSFAGRRPGAVALLDALTRFAGIRVVEFSPYCLNVPHDSPCFAGHVPAPYVAQADVGLMVDIDVPWIPVDTPENDATWWIQVDADCEKRDFPTWGFPVDHRVPGDSRKVLQAVLDRLQARAGADFRARAAERVRQYGEEHAARARKAAEAAARPGERGAIGVDYLCAALGRAIEPDDVLINEGIRNAASVFAQVPRTREGSLVGLAGGGLGFSSGMALGIRLATPHRTVVNVVGDGSFYFNNPQSVLAVAAEHRLPILTVVLDNGGWAAVKNATLKVYPDGVAKATQVYASDLPGGMDFAATARAAGAHGEYVDEPDEVEAALARCFEAVRGGKAAVLHARVTRL